MSLILSIFLLKGIFLATLFPIFSGQDEARHYNTVQFRLEPKEKNWEITNWDAPEIKNSLPKKQEKEKFETYNFSQEIRKTAEIIGSQTNESVPYNYLSFSEGYDGKGEGELKQKKWNAYNDWYPPDTAGSSSLYHALASIVEKFFSQNGILDRFFAIRIFSVILGLMAVASVYFIAKNSGFSDKSSLILAAIVSFQPRFSIYFTNINYDVLLIPAFFIFTLGGILSIKNGINWKNLLIMAVSTVIAILAKATGVILLAVLISFLAFNIFQKLIKVEDREIRKKYFFISGLIFLIVISFCLWNWHSFLKISSSKGLSVGDYLFESLGIGRIMLTSNAYWGNLDWENNLISNNFLKIIWPIEAVSLAGLVLFFFFKKKLKFLPEKKYIIFFILMVAALQFGVRFADFSIFTNLGSLELGAPGRYFLPNLASHLLLVFIGIGAILKKKEYFDRALMFGLILMMAFCFYVIFNIIIPRYYL